MPRYFFQLASHAARFDTEGSEFPSWAEARAEAVAFAGELMRDHPELVGEEGEMRVQVRDQQGRLVFLVMVQSVELTNAAPAAISAPMTAELVCDGEAFGCTCHACGLP